jgi:hypothetical protein
MGETRKKRESAGELEPAEIRKDLLRLCNDLLDRFGVLPDAVMGQALRWFILARNATKKVAYGNPEDYDFV